MKAEVKLENSGFGVNWICTCINRITKFELQSDALTQYGCTRVFHDKMSGAKNNVPVWKTHLIMHMKREYDCRLAIGSTRTQHARLDRKSTRLNSSHVSISYAVFCLKKQNL